MKSTFAAALACAAITSSAHSATLTTGTGDGAVLIPQISDYGTFFSASFDPPGEVGSANTVFESSVYLSGAGGRSRLDDAVTAPAVVVSSSDAAYVTRFGVGALDITLAQTLQASFDGERQVGSSLTQQFTIRNTGADTSFDLVRYMDGDLDFDGTLLDSGGEISVGSNRILFETDGAGGDDASTTFLGITSTTQGVDATVPERRFEIDAFDGLRSRIAGGADLDNTIEGDADGDGFIDGAYDVTLAFQNFVAVPENGEVTYTTQTLFGNAVPPAPGSTEAAALLPDHIGPAGGFMFEIDSADLNGDMLWIDPPISVGYTYVVTGAEFAAVQAPSFGAVPDGDQTYTLTVGGQTLSIASGEVVIFADLGLTGITMFEIGGIDPDLALDPDNAVAFPTGVALTNITGDMVMVTQTPVTVDLAPVPLPAPALMLAAGLLGLGGVRYRGRRRAA